MAAGHGLGDQQFTYAELDAAARGVANLLRSRGIEPGDKVALSCPNLPWFPIVYHGILKAGAVVVPLNVLLKGREIAYHLADSGAKAYFCFEGATELPLGQEGWSGFGQTPDCEHFFLMTATPAPISPIPGAQTLTAALADQSADFNTAATGADDTAVILYTSGTTGRAVLGHHPRGVRPVGDQPDRHLLALRRGDTPRLRRPTGMGRGGGPGRQGPDPGRRLRRSR